MRIRFLLAVLPVILSFSVSAKPSYRYFSMPSDNIYCEFEPRRIRCDVDSEIDKAKKKIKPKECKGNWGYSYGLSPTGKAFMMCIDTVMETMGGKPTLKYGQKITLYGITCTSQTTGLRCVNQSKHGFMLSRGSQIFF
jgi:hypothetical protein